MTECEDCKTDPYNIQQKKHFYSPNIAVMGLVSAKFRTLQKNDKMRYLYDYEQT